MSRSPYTLHEMEAALASAFPAADVQIWDESAAHAGHTGNPEGDAISHIRIRLRSPNFAALSTVAQHRAVHAALAPFYAQGLHAVTFDTAAR